MDGLGSSQGRTDTPPLKNGYLLKYLFIAPLLMYGAMWAQRPEPPTITITKAPVEYIVTDYTPGVEVQEGWARSLTYEQWRAVLVFPEEYQYAMARIGWCESKFDTNAIGYYGERGAWQVRPEFWGEVPPDLIGQARQASLIVQQWGTEPWSTKNGCEGWSR